MTYHVIWSKEAERSYLLILDWIARRWSHKEVESFIERTDNVIKLLQQHPLIYESSKTVQVHRAVITQQTSLYYQIEGSRVVLLSFEDNRQRPEKIKY